MDCVVFVADIVNKRVVHFYLMHDDVSLQYFMPVVSAWWNVCVCVCVCVWVCVCLCLCLCVCVCVCSLRVTGQCVFRAEIEQYDPNQWLALWEMFLWNCTGASIMLLYHWPLCWGWEWRDDSGTDLKTESPPGLCACGPPLYILSLGLHLHVMLMVGGLSGVRLKNTSFV